QMPENRWARARTRPEIFTRIAAVSIPVSDLCKPSSVFCPLALPFLRTTLVDVLDDFGDVVLVLPEVRRVFQELLVGLLALLGLGHVAHFGPLRSLGRCLRDLRLLGLGDRLVAATAAAAQRLGRIERMGAVRAMRRRLVKVVKRQVAIGTNTFGAETGL